MLAKLKNAIMINNIKQHDSFEVKGGQQVETMNMFNAKMLLSTVQSICFSSSK
uniref:Uncharacterized protein n=1 Tax=Onchocerca volvulus TaxID=6282 RepID=A0A8R1TNU5_ONCVO